MSTLQISPHSPTTVYIVIHEYFTYLTTQYYNSVYNNIYNNITYLTTQYDNSVYNNT